MQDTKLKLPPINSMGESMIKSQLRVRTRTDADETACYDEAEQKSKLGATTNYENTHSSKRDYQSGYIKDAPDNSDSDYPDDFESDSNTKRTKVKDKVSTPQKSINDNFKAFFQTINSISTKREQMPARVSSSNGEKEQADDYAMLAASTLDPQIENSGLYDEEQERRNKSMCVQSESNKSKESSYQLILPENVLNNSTLSENEETKEESPPADMKQAEVLESQDAGEISENNDTVAIPEKEVTVEEVVETKTDEQSDQPQIQKVDVQKSPVNRRYRSAPRKLTGSHTEEDFLLIHRNDQSHVQEAPTFVKPSPPVKRTSEKNVMTDNTTEFEPPVESKPQISAVSSAILVCDLQSNKKLSTLEVPTKTPPKPVKTKEELMKAKKEADDMIKKAWPVKKPAVPKRSVSVQKKPLNRDTSQGLNTQGAQKSKIVINKPMNASPPSPPKKLGFDGYLSEKAENTIKAYSYGKNDAELEYQNSILRKQIWQLNEFMRNLAARGQRSQKKIVQDSKLTWLLDEIKLNKQILETRTEEYNKLCGLIEKANNVEYKISLDRDIQALKETIKKEEREKRNLEYIEKKELLYEYPSSKNFAYLAMVPSQAHAMTKISQLNATIDTVKRQENKLKEKNQRAVEVMVQQEQHLKKLEDRYRELIATSMAYNTEVQEDKQEEEHNGEVNHYSNTKITVMVNLPEERQDTIETLQKEINSEERLLEQNTQEMERKTGILEELNIEIQKIMRTSQVSDEALEAHMEADNSESEGIRKTLEAFQNSSNLSVELNSLQKGGRILTRDQGVDQSEDYVLENRIVAVVGDNSSEGVSIRDSVIKAKQAEYIKNRRFYKAYHESSASKDSKIYLKGYSKGSSYYESQSVEIIEEYSEKEIKEEESQGDMHVKAIKILSDSHDKTIRSNSEAKKQKSVEEKLSENRSSAEKYHLEKSLRSKNSKAERSFELDKKDEEIAPMKPNFKKSSKVQNVKNLSFDSKEQHMKDSSSKNTKIYQTTSIQKGMYSSLVNPSNVTNSSITKERVVYNSLIARRKSRDSKEQKSTHKNINKKGTMISSGPEGKDFLNYSSIQQPLENVRGKKFLLGSQETVKRDSVAEISQYFNSDYEDMSSIKESKDQSSSPGKGRFNQEEAKKKVFEDAVQDKRRELESIIQKSIVNRSPKDEGLIVFASQDTSEPRGVKISQDEARLNYSTKLKNTERIEEEVKSESVSAKRKSVTEKSIQEKVIDTDSDFEVYKSSSRDFANKKESVILKMENKPVREQRSLQKQM